MPDNAQKQWLANNLNAFALQKVQNQLQILGKALPCTVRAISTNGALVTVAFNINSGFTLPIVTVPRNISKYLRSAVAAGDVGIVRPIDVYLGGVSGLGNGTADLSQRANLSTLVYEPVGNASWTTADPALNYLNAPHGAVIQTTDGAAVVTISQTQISAVFGTASLLLTATQASLTFGANGIVITTTGVSINGHDWASHRHSDVVNGPDDTGGVV